MREIITNQQTLHAKMLGKDNTIRYLQIQRPLPSFHSDILYPFPEPTEDLHSNWLQTIRQTAADKTHVQLDLTLPASINRLQLVLDAFRTFGTFSVGYMNVSPKDSDPAQKSLVLEFKDTYYASLAAGSVSMLNDVSVSIHKGQAYHPQDRQLAFQKYQDPSNWTPIVRVLSIPVLIADEIEAVVKNVRGFLQAMKLGDTLAMAAELVTPPTADTSTSSAGKGRSVHLDVLFRTKVDAKEFMNLICGCSDLTCVFV